MRDRRPQLNDKCSNCIESKTAEIGKLQYIKEYYPYIEEHLWCKKCNSTYVLDHKVLWQDEINNIACDMIDILEARLRKAGMILAVDESDILYGKVIDIISDFGTGDYRNYN